MSRNLNTIVQNGINILAALLVLLCAVGLFTDRAGDIPSYLSIALFGVVIAQNIGLRQQIDSLQANVAAITE